MDVITYKSKKIYLDNRTQYGSLGEAFMCRGVELDTTKPAKWIDRVERHIAIWNFRYLDNLEKGFKITTGYNDEFIAINKF